tara:strand:- start:1783 stop:2289 length:507 start_codon:yes stop_codon:yes gene_type:complete
MNEKDLYDPICFWLQNHTSNLINKKKIKSIECFDVHNKYLNNFIQQNNLIETLGKDSIGWKIKVDIFGYIQTKTLDTITYIAEVKDKQASLIDLSQLIGYVSVCSANHAYLISSKGFSQDLLDLIQVMGRKDLLRIYSSKQMGKYTTIEMLYWDVNTDSPDNFKSIKI